MPEIICPKKTNKQYIDQNTHMKRLTRHTVDLAALAERVRPEAKPQMDAFRERCQKYVAAIDQLPAEMPKLDWDFYRKNVKSTVVGVVDQFKSAYEQFKVPEPVDTQTAIVDTALVQTKEQIAVFKAASVERCCALRTEIDQINALLPFEQMTLEDYIDAFPQHGPDFLNRPTFWPHNDEEQLSNGELHADGGVHLLAGEAHLLQRLCGLRERLAHRIEDTQRLEAKRKSGVRSRDVSDSSECGANNVPVGIGATPI